MTKNFADEKRKLRLLAHSRSLERAVVLIGGKPQSLQSDSLEVSANRIVGIIESGKITPMSRLAFYNSGLAYMYSSRKGNNVEKAKIYFNRALGLEDKQDVKYNVTDKEIYDTLVELTKEE